MNKDVICELHSFNNPKCSVTALIIKDNKLLMLNRNEEPFKDWWDLPGGYLNGGETPSECIEREMKEELGVDIKRKVLYGHFPGTAEWKGEKFNILSVVYLLEVDGEINLNDENSAYKWVSIKDIEDVAFDSNQDIVQNLKERMVFDLDRLKELVSQLDNTFELDEFRLYEAALGGYLAQVLEGDKLVGMGWAFPRTTLLRRQAVVEDMIVDEKERGKGLGRVILKQVIKKAIEKGMDTMELTTNPKRVAANELYKSEGFWLHETNHYLLKLSDYENN